MNELELTYPNLLEQALAASNEKIQKIIEMIEHYKRLKMSSELIQKAKNGAVSVLLSSMGMQMLRSEPDFEGEHLVFKVDELGNENKENLSWGPNSPLWELTSLKEYTDPVPLEILEQLPNTATDKAWVFHPTKKAARDPILVYPLMYKNPGTYIKIKETLPTTGIARFISPTYTSIKTVVVPGPGPYFAGVFKWD